MSYTEAIDSKDSYMREVRSYLRKVDRGRSVLSVDPDQPALSHEAETVRQAQAVDKANAQNTDEPPTFDFSEEGGATDPQVFDFSSSEPSPDRVSGDRKGTPEPASTSKPFHPGQILDWVMNPLDPSLRQDVEKVTGKSELEFLKPSTWTPSNIGKSLAGTAADALTTPMSYIGTPFVGKAAGMAPKPNIAAPITTLTKEQLDMQIASRAVTKSAIETGAFPDATATVPSQPGTGRTLITPNLDPGDLTYTKTDPTFYHTGDSLTGNIPMLPGMDTLNMAQRPPYPSMQQGEYGGVKTPFNYGEGEQLDLLGGHNVRGEQPHLIGATPIEPGEQLPQTMLPLREQRLLKPATTADYQQEFSDFLTKALKTRVLTPAQERTLHTAPSERGNFPVQVDVQYSKGGTAMAGPNNELKLPGDLNVSNTADGAVFPSLYARMGGSVIDAIKSAGDVGKYMGTLLDNAYTNRAIGNSSDMLPAVSKLDQLFGKSTFAERSKIGVQQLAAGENPFIQGMRREWKVSPELEEQIFNYMYTGRRMTPKDPRAAQAGDILFEHGLFPASNHPGVRTLEVTNPFTGKKTPVGNPDMFMPQQPVHEITANAISDTHWNILYERAGGEKLGVPMSKFKSTIIALSRHDPEVTAAKMRGIENMRLLDLEALGGSPYQWAKKLGYETDPFRSTYRYNSLARLRGELKAIEPTVNELMIKGQVKPGDFLDLAVKRAMMNPGAHDVRTDTANMLRGVSHVMDVSMLQLGGLANLAQSSYIAARGGGRATFKGLFDMVTGVDRDIVQRSGALFPSVLNELTNPTGPMATWSSGAFRLYGLALVDRGTRNFAGHVGNRFVSQITDNLLKNPTSQRLQGLIRELGGDPKVVLEKGAVPDEMRLSMIQRFANHTAGVTDVRGVPLWASSENPYARLVHKYRTFAAANTAEVRRLITGAPDVYTAAKRVATLVAGAYVVGGGINEMREGLRNYLMGDEAKPTKKGLMLHAERLIQGLGTIEGMFTVQALHDPKQAMISALGGPAAGVGTSLMQDLYRTAQDGVGWRSIRTISKRLPVAGPVVGPMVEREVQKERELTKQKKQWLTP